jgi:hypothetical protein
VFRDRFSNFESEPDTQLWQKIEPKLPADSTKKFPYWQISSVVILLLLASLWNYFKIQTDDSQTGSKIKSDESHTLNKTKLDDNQVESNSSSDYPVTGVIPTRITENKSLIINDLSKNMAKKVTVKSEDNINIPKPLNRFSQNGNKEFLFEGNDKKLVITNKNKKYSLFSNLKKTIEISKASFNKTNDNNSPKNNKFLLNLLPVNNSKEKQEIIEENSSNNQSVSSVFYNKKQVLVLSKQYLTFLDTKSYSLLVNHFKTPRIKSVIVPKKDNYFRETKPLEMYASVMPLLNYYTITPNGNDANYVHSIAVNNGDDRLGFYTQAGLIFTLSDKFKLRTGLTFTKTNHSINYQIRTDSLVIQSPDNKGFDVSFAEINKTYSQVANYLGTKIEVQYVFLEGEALTHYLNVGLEGAYRLNGSGQFNGFTNFAYGVTRQIGDNAYLFVEPTFSYSLNQQSDNNSFLLIKPNKIGFNIGVNFKIK